MYKTIRELHEWQKLSDKVERCYEDLRQAQIELQAMRARILEEEGYDMYWSLPFQAGSEHKDTPASDDMARRARNALKIAAFASRASKA